MLPLVRRPLLLLVVLTTLLPIGVPPASAGTDVLRLAGPTRLETAVRISTDTYDGGDADAVVLARADEFPDALAGAPLAAAKRAPLLLTPTDSLAPVVADEISRVLPEGGTVYLLGGPVALSDTVRADVEALGYVTMRLAGPSRYETALAIADEASTDPAFITIADGDTFPDALIAGSLAAAFADSVTVLTAGEVLPETVASYLDGRDPSFGLVTIGPAAEAALNREDVFNVAGPDAATRSVEAARAFYGTDPTGVSLASVEAFPDGLAGGAHAFRAGRVPLLLTFAGDLPQAHRAYIAELSADGRSHVYGGNRAIEEVVVDQLRAALAS